MTDKQKTKQELIQELDLLRQRVADLEQSELGRKQAEEELKAERQRLRDVLEAMPIMVCLLTPDYHVAFANRAFREKFGESHGRRCYEYCFGKKEPCDFCETYRVLKTAKPHHWQVTTLDGASVIDVYDFPFTDVGGLPMILEVDIDITELKRAEEVLRERSLELQQLNETLEQRVVERTAELAATNEALRHLSTKLLSAQEDERKRIAGNLHDTLGASLVGIKFKVERALEQIGDPANAASESLNTTIPEIQEAVEECRRIQMDLRPSMLDDLGLLPTLSWFCRRFQAIYSEIRIEQEIEIKEEDVPPPLKIIAFRVTQEAMNNIAKHGQADLVCLSLRKKDSSLELILRDNGRGFNLEKARSKETTRRGLGLASMRERTELSGGSFDIESTEGKGTIIRASWPTEQLSR